MSTDLVPQPELVPTSTLFGTSDPGAALEQMTRVADTLSRFVIDRHLVTRIGQSDHVRVEGWTFLGSLLGVFPIVVWTRPVLNAEGETIGWEARVEARTRTGEVVGAAEAECLRSERAWASREDYALRSMAQTRAISKAMRGPLGFVMQLGGFNPTPAEEMPSSGGEPMADFPGTLAPSQQRAGASVTQASMSTEPASPPDTPPATAAQKKKLNVLVGQLRPDHISTEQLYEHLGAEQIVETGHRLHWSPLRESLTKKEASAMIEWLEAVQQVATTPAQITELSAQLIGASSQPDQAALMIENHAAAHEPWVHLAWLKQQAKQFDIT